MSTERPEPINDHERWCPDCQRVIRQEQDAYDSVAVFQHYRPGLVYDDRRGGYVRVLYPDKQPKGAAQAVEPGPLDAPRYMNHGGAMVPDPDGKWLHVGDHGAKERALDVHRLERAIADHHDICSRMAIPECAVAIAAEYARLSSDKQPKGAG